MNDSNPDFQLSRRTVMGAGGAALGALLAGTAAANQPQGQAAKPGLDTNKPDKPPPRENAGGKPVSDTAAAQEGSPTVPGPPRPKVKFALVGLGKLMVGEILAAVQMSSECEIAALVTGDPSKGRAIAANLRLPTERVFGYEDIARFKDDAGIDAVYIATPNSLHARDTVTALNAGKHVLCEKPLATTLADADRMIGAAKQNDRRLMTAYRVHYEPLNLAIREMIRERTYGDPHFMTFDTVLDVGSKPQYRLSRELAGGGSLFDIGIYALNTTCWLLGETPIEISAMHRHAKVESRFDEVEGSIAFQLRFPSGCIANCTSSYGTARVNRYRVICSKGWMGMDPATEYRNLRAEHGTDDEVSIMKKPQTVNQFAAEFDYFARCCRGEEQVESPGEEGRRDLDLMLKIYAAAQSGGAVKLS